MTALDGGLREALAEELDTSHDWTDAAAAIRRALDGPQSPPSGPGRAEGGGQVSSGGSTLRTNNVTTKLGGA